MRIIVTFLCANSDVNYNYILVSKDVLQLSGKEVGLSCERVTVTVSRGIIYSWELNWYIKLPYKNCWRLTARSYHASIRQASGTSYLGVLLQCIVNTYLQYNSCSDYKLCYLGVFLWNYESKWHVRRLRRNFINVRYLAEVLCRMLPFSPRGNSEIVNQSHMVGACPPPRVNISTGKVYSQSLLSQAFVLRLFSVLQLYQLEDYSLFLFTLVFVPHILREDELATYPQGG